MTDNPNQKPNDPNTEPQETPVEPPPPSHQPATAPPRTGPGAPPTPNEPDVRYAPWPWVVGTLLILAIVWLIWR